MSFTSGQVCAFRGAESDSEARYSEIGTEIREQGGDRGADVLRPRKDPRFILVYIRACICLPQPLRASTDMEVPFRREQ